MIIAKLAFYIETITPHFCDASIKRQRPGPVKLPFQTLYRVL